MKASAFLLFPEYVFFLLNHLDWPWHFHFSKDSVTSHHWVYANKGRGSHRFSRLHAWGKTSTCEKVSFTLPSLLKSDYSWGNGYWEMSSVFYFATHLVDYSGSLFCANFLGVVKIKNWLYAVVGRLILLHSGVLVLGMQFGHWSPLGQLEVVGNKRMWSLPRD